jgi:hypothetical protein
VVFVALGLFRIVASIYKPFSVNALIGAVECFNESNRSKILTSSIFSFLLRVIIYSFGNLSGLFLTA